MQTNKNQKFARRVNALSGENVYLCQQCGKCSGCCPMRFAMSLSPNRVLRYVQMERAEVLEANTIWLCATCLSCTVRCPKGLDLAKVMEALRLVRLRKNVDRVCLSTLSRELPQAAVVSNLRKTTG